MPKPEVNISILIKGCLKGNRSSQRKLYEHFYGYAMSICLRYVQNRDEAVEVLNEGFFRVFTSLGRYEQSRPFKAWFRSILVRTAIDHHRKYRRLPTYVELTEADHDSGTDDEVNWELSEDLTQIIQKIPPQYRLVFNLYVMEEYKHDEIAEMLGITAGTSRSNLLRAKQKLKELLTQKYPKLKRIG